MSGLTSNATGTVTFRLWNNANCSGGTVFSDTKPLGTVTAGVAIVTSANYTPTAAGSYYWIASYSGDANNVTVAGHCGDAGETSTVTKTAPRITTLADASATLPAGTLSDTAQPLRADLERDRHRDLPALRAGRHAWRPDLRPGQPGVLLAAHPDREQRQRHGDGGVP